MAEREALDAAKSGLRSCGHATTPVGVGLEADATGKIILDF